MEAMANNTHESAVVLYTADHQVQILRASDVRQLDCTPTLTKLVVRDERNQYWNYILILPSIAPLESDDGDPRFEDLKPKLFARAVAAFFLALLDGEQQCEYTHREPILGPDEQLK
jgi:hypothetical protein